MNIDVTLEESTTESVTLLLHETVKRILAGNQTSDCGLQKDLLFILIVVLMIENGFSPIDDNLEDIDLKETFNQEQLSKWKLPTGIYEANFVLTGFKNTSLKLIMSPLGAIALVNIVINEMNFDTYSICLPMSRYVVSLQAPSIPLIFRDLKHFAVTVRNKVLSAVKSRILGHYGYANASLSGLPEEVLHNIFYRLPIKDIINVCKTCSRLCTILDNQRFWLDLYKRDFPKNELDENTRNWKNEYKTCNRLEQLKSLSDRSDELPEMYDPLYNPMADMIM